MDKRNIYKGIKPQINDKVIINIKPYNDNFVTGRVAKVLTKSKHHDRGHKLILKNGKVGRVVKILEIHSDNLKRIPGGKRSGLPYNILVEMVKNKTAVFFVDKADPKDFPKNSEIGIKQGQHIHAIFKKGEYWGNNGKKILVDTTNNIGFVKIIKDNNGKEWAILDHNLNPESDVHLINSFTPSI